MPIYKTLTQKNQQNISKARTFLTTTATSISHNNTFPLYPLCNHSFAPHLKGPLFLSFPPWKLSQFSTPLYLRGNRNVLRKVESFNINLSLNLLKNRIGSKQNAVERVEEVKGQNGILESFVNLPNLISLSRLVSGPVIGWMITNGMYSYAFAGLAVSGATDWLDGYVARKMRIDSVVGSYLDPLADKVLIGSVAVGMVHMDLLHPGLVALVVLRDVGLVGGAVYHRAKTMGWKFGCWYDFFNLDGTRPEKVEPLFISKDNFSSENGKCKGKSDRSVW